MNKSTTAVLDAHAWADARVARSVIPSSKMTALRFCRRYVRRVAKQMTTIEAKSHFNRMAHDLCHL